MADAAKAVGIGIIFDAGESGAGPEGDGLVVNGLAPTGPAARSGKIMLGDLLCTVDGMDVKGIAAGIHLLRVLMAVCQYYIPASSGYLVLTHMSRNFCCALLQRTCQALS